MVPLKYGWGPAEEGPEKGLSTYGWEAQEEAQVMPPWRHD
jgi:hypothetical protein